VFRLPGTINTQTDPPTFVPRWSPEKLRAQLKLQERRKARRAAKKRGGER
jgi:hypothetical protein